MQEERYISHVRCFTSSWPFFMFLGALESYQLYLLWVFFTLWMWPVFTLQCNFGFWSNDAGGEVELITSFNYSFSLILCDIKSIWTPIIIALRPMHDLVNPFSIYFAIQFLLSFKFEIWLDIGHMISIKVALPALSTCSYSPTGRGQNQRHVFKSCDLLVQHFVPKFCRFNSTTTTATICWWSSHFCHITQSPLPLLRDVGRLHKPHHHLPPPRHHQQWLHMLHHYGDDCTCHITNTMVSHISLTTPLFFEGLQHPASSEAVWIPHTTLFKLFICFNNGGLFSHSGDDRAVWYPCAALIHCIYPNDNRGLFLPTIYNGAAWSPHAALVSLYSFPLYPPLVLIMRQRDTHMLPSFSVGEHFSCGDNKGVVWNPHATPFELFIPPSLIVFFSCGLNVLVSINWIEFL